MSLQDTYTLLGAARRPDAGCVPPARVAGSSQSDYVFASWCRTDPSTYLPRRPPGRRNPALTALRSSAGSNRPGGRRFRSIPSQLRSTPRPISPAPRRCRPRSTSPADRSQHLSRKAGRALGPPVRRVGDGLRGVAPHAMDPGGSVPERNLDAQDEALLATRAAEAGDRAADQFTMRRLSTSSTLLCWRTSSS